MLDTSKLGEPVPVGQIDRELKKLWETGSGVTTRASLINFAVYCRGAEAMAGNTELISRFTQSHACRALLVCVERDAPAPHVSAWINAHCHLSRAGAKQICCEQISFLLEGEIRGRLTNIVFAHLDSDLPLYFWWQGDFSEQLNPHLWSWIDRLIIDSLAWEDPKPQFARLQASLSETNARLTLRDLNWTRSLYLRQAISQIFDHPENVPYLNQLQRIIIRHGNGNRTTALLLAGWLAGQLGWKLKSSEPIMFTTPGQGEVALELQSGDGEAISFCELQSAGASFAIKRDTTSRFLHTELRLPEDRTYHHLLPAGPDEMVDLLDEEMARGSRHRIYLKALSIVEPLL